MITKTYFKTKDHCKVKFSFTEAAETVAVVGLNNDWETSITLSKKKDGTFSCDVNLPKDSQHEFKYLVNGIEWINEPAADSEVTNVYGGSNSVLVL
jgi:1,4-alpha-glucan branching enzyme